MTVATAGASKQYRLTSTRIWKQGHFEQDWCVEVKVVAKRPLTQGWMVLKIIRAIGIGTRTLKFGSMHPLGAEGLSL